MGYTYGTCPYCDEETEINYEGNEDGDEFEVECSKCGKEFNCSIEFDAHASCEKIKQARAE